MYTGSSILDQYAGSFNQCYQTFTLSRNINGQQLWIVDQKTEYCKYNIHYCFVWFHYMYYFATVY